MDVVLQIIAASLLQRWGTSEACDLRLLAAIWADGVEHKPFESGCDRLVDGRVRWRQPAVEKTGLDSEEGRIL